MTEFKPVFHIGKPRESFHSQDREELLWLLAVATEKDLPLIPLLAAQADQHKFPWKTYLLNLISKLEQGLPLVQAVREVPRMLAESSLLTLRLGEETGTVTASLREAAHQYSQRNRPRKRNSNRTLGYLGFVGFVTLFMLSFYCYYILPRMKKIFEDFNAELPWMTRSLINFGELFVTYFYLITILMVILLLLWKWKLRSLFERRVRRTVTPAMLRNFAIAVEAERPLPDVISSLARSTQDRALSRELLFVRNEIHQGEPLWTSLAQVQLITKEEAGVLESAQRAENLPWALRELARNIRRKGEHKLEILFEWLRPLGILLIGGLVGFIYLAMFMPLLMLINGFA